MSDFPKPTERDRYWLDHEAAIESSGQTAKDYAAAQELSLHALYQARKRLRALGLLETARAVRSDRKKPAKRTSFAKVDWTPPAKSSSEFRLTLPNGLVLEWSGGDLPSPVVDLVERLTQSR